MAGNEVIGIDVVAKVDGLKAELAKLAPGMEKEAKAMVVALEKELKRAEAAAKKSAAATKAAGDAVSNSYEKALKAMGPLGGVLSKLSPELGSVASSIAGATSAVEGFGAAGVASIGAVAPAVVALSAAVTVGYGVWNYYATAADHAADVQDRLNAVMVAGESAASRLANMGLDLAVVTGQITSEEARYQRTVAASTKTLEDKSAAIAKETGLTESQMAASVMAAEHSTAAYDSMSEAQKKAVDLYRVANAEAQGTVIIAGKLRDAEMEAKAATESKAKAQKTAAVEFVESIDYQTAEFRARVASQMAARQEQLDADKLAAEESRRVFMERVEAEQAAQMAADEAMAESAWQLAEAKAEAARQAGEEMVSATADAAGSIGDLISLEYERRAAVAADLQAYLEANEATLTEAQKAALEERIATQQEKAREAFEISKGVQIAGALANTALAIVNALATVPYPAAPFVAAAAGVAGTAQVATIAATEPSFHAGGEIGGDGMYSDERRVKALAGEVVVDRVSAASAGGAEGVRAALQGGGGDSRPIFRIGRIEAREIIRTDVRAGGALPTEIRKVVSRGGRRVGISGRGVIA